MYKFESTIVDKNIIPEWTLYFYSFNVIEKPYSFNFRYITAFEAFKYFDDDTKYHCDSLTLYFNTKEEFKHFTLSMKESKNIDLNSFEDIDGKLFYKNNLKS